AGAVVGAGYALERSAAGRWRVDEEALAAGGRTLPADLEHHFVPVSDGGRIHAVERGEGPPVVLVPGITLGVATWAPQLRQLSRRCRVVAVSQRGHGQSVAGDGGYGLDRLADDLLEVLAALDVYDGVLGGHSMGGMVCQILAVRHPERIRRHVRRLVLIATSPGPVVAEPLVPALTALAGRGLRRAERRGGGLFPGHDVGVWATRLGFGARPAPADVELTRSMVDAMSPATLSALVPALLGFCARDRLAAVDLPTRVVVGSRDLLTPPRTGRALARLVGGAELSLLPGCGHMVMLERADELCDLLV
ncbi:MAG: alpha/beta fold hydrolase, partial [Acidimicrobiales bacterium]